MEVPPPGRTDRSTVFGHVWITRYISTVIVGSCDPTLRKTQYLWYQVVIIFQLVNKNFNSWYFISYTLYIVVHNCESSEAGCTFIVIMHVWFRVERFSLGRQRLSCKGRPRYRTNVLGPMGNLGSHPVILHCMCTIFRAYWSRSALLPLWKTGVDACSKDINGLLCTILLENELSETWAKW